MLLAKTTFLKLPQDLLIMSSHSRHRTNNRINVTRDRRWDANPHLPFLRPDLSPPLSLLQLWMIPNSFHIIDLRITYRRRIQSLHHFLGRHTREHLFNNLS